FDTKKPFLCDLVPAVVEVMGHAFPELKRNPISVVDLVRDEEESFIKTLDRGIKLFQEAAERAKKKRISGEDAFKLHDTYGVYIDITEQMAAETGLTVDRAGYEKLMQEAKDRARQSRKKLVITAVQGELPKTDDSPKYNAFSQHGGEAKILGWVKDNVVITSGKLSADDDDVALLLDRTCFYAEQGGQIADRGVIETKTGRFTVGDTQKLGDGILHIGIVAKGSLEVGQQASLQILDDRRDTMRNHTATHLMNWALRKVLGDHIEQKGSLVDAEKTRFDFTHNAPLSDNEIDEIERLVNEKIYSDLPVKPITMPLSEAKKIAGVRAVFGEKYPDPVRVLLVGVDDPGKASLEDSVEFCGGTHLNHTGEAGFFKIISQEGVAKGVRRVTATTGKKAVEHVQMMNAVVDQLSGRLNCKLEELPTRVAQLQDELKKLQTQIKKGVASDLAGVVDKLFVGAQAAGGARVIIGEIPAGPEEQIRQQLDRLRQKAGSAVVLLAYTEEERVMLYAAVTDDLVKKGLHAGKIMSQVAKVVGGGGGGKPNMAQAGGKEPAKLQEALELARKLAAEQLG
ncbi:MAG: alanine--tRNA ligase, partial [Gemmataceae bacterium]